MRICYDTEFLEDGETIDLISIGMVAEDGRELYLINDELLWNHRGRPDWHGLYRRVCSHEWLLTNVVPHLPLLEMSDGDGGQIKVMLPESGLGRSMYGAFHLDPHDLRVVPRRHIANSVRRFLDDTPDPQLWAWYGAYDHVVLAQLFGPMVQRPDNMPMWTHDLNQLLEQRGNPQLPPRIEDVHHALADARYVHKVLLDLEKP